MAFFGKILMYRQTFQQFYYNCSVDGGRIKVYLRIALSLINTTYYVHTVLTQLYTTRYTGKSTTNIYIKQNTINTDLEGNNKENNGTYRKRIEWQASTVRN